MKCPICKETLAEKIPFHPFCSRRCADVDLSKWLKGSYAIPGLPADAAEDVPPGDEDY
ncbi:MAG: DNA gyrase inhibitor YacG [Hyphomonadaceae bacterium]|nr:DNA gyrase inhibitor YacG [Hyphomonadaceae bacterium]OUX95528.1 MAG: DNA gyrase inhibitor YacG [Hyphomonas sp. TMED17]CAI8373333.1 MAG: DNA gyrase inhibitor YacG [Hyphomonas sp. TMED17]